MADYGSNYPYGQSIYKDEGLGSYPPRHELAMRKLFPIDKLKDDQIFLENYEVMGRHLDYCEDSGNAFLVDIFPDTSTDLLESYETTFNLPVLPSDSIETRRNRIITAMRVRGKLNKAYFEALGNKLGDGDYTVSLAEGTGNIGFIVDTYSTQSSPAGAATVLPGQVSAPPYDESCYLITVTVTGAASAPDLEKLFDRLKPAWNRFEYSYVP